MSTVQNLITVFKWRGNRGGVLVDAVEAQDFCTQIHLFLFFSKIPFFPLQSQAKGVMHLFVSIKPELKLKWRKLRDQIAAFGRTTRSFCRRTIQMTQCLPGVPVCNWWLWISYSTYFTFPFQPFFLSFLCVIYIYVYWFDQKRLVRVISKASKSWCFIIKCQAAQ